MGESVFDVVVFRVDAALYALPLPVVERVLPMVAIERLPEAPEIALGVVNAGGRILPVVDLRRRFGFPPRAWSPASRLLVARTARRVLALPADDVLGVKQFAQASVASPGTVLPGTRHLAGIVALPDGILYIQDIDAFLSLEEDRQLGEAMNAGP